MKSVIVGGTHPNTLSMIRSMGMRGINVDVVLCEKDDVDSYVLSSKYINKSFKVHNSKEAVEILREKYANACTIICSDDVAAILNERNALYMNKLRQVKLAHSLGLSVPYSKEIEVWVDNVEFDYYPCIVKPLESVHGGKRINVCEDRYELSNVLDGYNQGDKVLVQQFIKRDFEIVVDGVSLGNGKIVIPGFVRKHRDVKGGTSYATTYSCSQLPKNVVNQIKQMVKAIGYEGLFGVEFIVTGNDYYFIEMNLRNDATTYALAVAGVNLPYIYYLSKLGHDYSVISNRRVVSINAMMEIRDVAFVLKGKVPLWQWLKELKGSECRYYYNKDDMAPYRKARNEYITSLFGKFLKRLK